MDTCNTQSDTVRPIFNPGFNPLQKVLPLSLIQKKDTLCQLQLKENL